MVANSGYFQFLIDENGNKDTVGDNTIKTFRLEKMARSRELVVSTDA
ncbi:MAG: hypothetical protein HQK89_04165 [Nitrospirae bacterium]|nr:hypothetical protein [Nitrospirota bacterium]